MDWNRDQVFRRRTVQYIDLDEGEMMHWKYVKRIRLPNGKWRYYYKEDKSGLSTARESARIAQTNAFRSDLAVSKAKYDYDKALQAYQNASGWNRIAALDSMRAAENALNKATKQNKKAYAEAERVLKKYEKKKKSDFRQSTVSKGIVKVANLFSRLFG